MFSKVIAIIPFWTVMKGYSAEAKRKAIPKFLVLWVMSLAPLILAAILQVIPEDENTLLVIFKKFGVSFFAKHQFIYAVSFITPIFYFLWERHQDLLTFFSSNKRRRVKLTPPGFGVVLIWSTIFFLLTAIAYALAETPSNSPRKTTFLESYSDIITVIVYVFGLACWYFMMLDGAESPDKQYYATVEHEQEQEKQQAKAFEERISKSENDA